MRLRNFVLGAVGTGSLLVGAMVLPADANPHRPTGAKAHASAAVGGTRDCSHSHTNRDPRSGQFFDGSGVNIRTGPHTSCTSVGHGQLSHMVDYHCYAVGDTVNGWSTWTYLRDVTTNTYGWVNDSHLDYRDATRGSFYEC